MNYYEHHIGDYDKATAHLSACEDGIYCRLLRRYYDTETPIINDIKAVQRLVRARTKEEKEAVEIVLDEFFMLADDGLWHHKRCDFEVAKYQDKQAKARSSAKARWNRTDTATHSEGNANASAEAMRTHSEGNAHQTPDTRHQTPEEGQNPSAIAESEKPKNGFPRCPIDSIIKLYGEELPSNPQLKVRTPAREAAIRARWQQFYAEGDFTTEDGGIECFRWFFGKVKRSKFLTGQTERPFRADLEWLMKAGNFAKIVEGRYDDNANR